MWYELTTAFLEAHRGFLLKELVAQVEGPEHLLGMRNTGALLWNGAGTCYGDFSAENLQDIVMKPHVVGLRRGIALTQPGS